MQFRLSNFDLLKAACLPFSYREVLGPVYTVRTKLQKFLRSYVEGVYTLQNGAYERNGLTAYSVVGHNIVLNWMMEITD